MNIAELELKKKTAHLLPGVGNDATKTFTEFEMLDVVM